MRIEYTLGRILEIFAVPWAMLYMVLTPKYISTGNTRRWSIVNFTWLFEKGSKEINKSLQYV